MTLIWPVDKTGLPELAPAPDPVTPEWLSSALQHNAALSLASQIMHRLSAGQFGLQEVTARPCPISRPRAHVSGAVTSYLVSWEGYGWVGVPCGCAGSCRLSGPNAVHLPGPVHRVLSVQLADVVLPSNVWTVENNTLYRRDAPWPGQDLGKPIGQQGTWVVRYERGIPVPTGVAALTGLLAKEIHLALTPGDTKCRLPRTVTTVSRNGVTYRAYDPAVIYANGKTGIPEIDLWLASINPHQLMSAPSVI